MITAVFGVVVYRIIMVSYMYTIDHEDIRVFAKILTSFTAAIINLIFILIMNRVCTFMDNIVHKILLISKNANF